MTASTSAATIRIFAFGITGTAGESGFTSWHKRQFGNFSTTLATFPVSLMHIDII
jgi:hypothetical protein